MSALTRQQFAAADLAVRQEIDARPLDNQELAVLAFYIKRTFPLGRVAAYFRSFQHLADLTGLKWKSHAHEAFKRLCAKKVLVRYCPDWYGININFLDWPKASAGPKTFDEELELPREPELRELITEAFIDAAGKTVLPTEYCGPTAIASLDRGRDAVPASEPAGIGAGERITPPPSLLQTKTEIITDEYMKRFYQALADGTVQEKFPEYTSYAETQPGPRECVPFKGTVGVTSEKGTFPSPERSFKRNAANANDDAGLKPDVPLKGTSIAKTASSTKAKPASYPAGTRADLSAEAWRWLQGIDTTGGLKIKRFAQQWAQVCEKHPDYVLKVLPNVLDRALERDGHIAAPLALCAKDARQYGKMR